MNWWFPIVHGRTAFADFRPNLIVAPDGFTDADVAWAKQYILATTRDAEELPARPRWSVFRNERHVVVGVTCMAREVSPDMTREVVVRQGREEERRELYVFLGFAASEPARGLPPPELALFSPLYRYIRQRWYERPYESDKLYFSDPWEPFPRLVEPPLLSPEWNTERDMLRLWPHSLAHELWPHAAGAGTLCTGLAGRTQALASPFTNATVWGSEADELITRAASRERAYEPRAGHAEDFGGGAEDVGVGATGAGAYEGGTSRTSSRRREGHAGDDAHAFGGSGRRPHSRHAPKWGFCELLTDVVRVLTRPLFELERILRGDGGRRHRAERSAREKVQPRGHAPSPRRGEYEPAAHDPHRWMDDEAAHNEAPARSEPTARTEAQERYGDFYKKPEGGTTSPGVPRGFRRRDEPAAGGDTNSPWNGWGDKPPVAGGEKSTSSAPSDPRAGSSDAPHDSHRDTAGKTSQRQWDWRDENDHERR